MSANAERTTVRLDGNMVLRIRDGRGTRLRSAGGVVWVTQEGSANDTVLEVGADMTLDFDGTTLVGAPRGTPVVVEVLEGAVPPTCVETMDGNGSSRVLLPRRSRLVALLRRELVRVTRRLRLANGDDAHFDAAHALEWTDGLPARRGRRASTQHGTTLHKELLDPSTLWRQS